jgi:hypothetical protein
MLPNLKFAAHSALLGAVLLQLQPSLRAFEVRSSPGEAGGLVLVDGATAATVLVDGDDHPVVQLAAGLFADDVERVTSRRPTIAHETPAAGPLVIVGTLGRSRLIAQLVADGKLRGLERIAGRWEATSWQMVERPFPGVERAFVIVGSDRRGTAYGLMRLSEKIGVSPWYWWADVPVARTLTLAVFSPAPETDEPSVKYRGIFINDEDWGMKPWAEKNFEKELGDIGPKTYARVCELLLRLRGNMLAPAMHSCTGAFYSHPGNKEVADRYGIIVTTSHCEPLLFNNAAKSEWDKARDGEWNYATNAETIRGKLDARVSEAARYENLYTVGMRGLHDEGLRGNLSMPEKVQILEKVIADERAILQRHLGKAPSEIPQIFVPYKETLDLYNAGLVVPDDVTLVWTDDNYGYLKRLSDPTERRRTGGAGVYYHTSYLGAPHDYLWLCTTPPALMFAELKKAYDCGADRYWLLNIGDIKPAELAMQTFFELAWRVPGFDAASINRHQSRLLASLFGAEHEAAFQDILDTYYRLAWSRKPEFMGWEREWDAPEYSELADTEFSFENYNDARQRLADYRRIADLTETISSGLPEEKRAAFFELVGYPVQGASQMNRKFLLAQLSRARAKAGDFAAANWAAEQSRAAFDEIARLTERYNNLLDGKWRGMMALAPGWTAKYQNMPEVVWTDGAGSAPVDLAPQPEQACLEGCTVIDLAQFADKASGTGRTVRLVDGLGYDGQVVQLGAATEASADPADLGGARIEYTFSGVSRDTVTVRVYSVPFFPLHQGKCTRFGLSVDGRPVVVASNERTEYSKTWKDQVLQNGALHVATFAIDPAAATHTLTITCGDPGVMIQRIIVDCGGLKPTYVGPSTTLAARR